MQGGWRRAVHPSPACGRGAGGEGLRGFGGAPGRRPRLLDRLAAALPLLVLLGTGGFRFGAAALAAAGDAIGSRIAGGDLGGPGGEAGFEPLLGVLPEVTLLVFLAAPAPARLIAAG